MLLSIIVPVYNMASELLQYFPNFRNNKYYKERINPEEKKLIDMACKNTLMFVLYYKLLWGYRNTRKKLGI